MAQQFGESANWGWHILKLAFRPGSASHYHTAMNLWGEHDEERCLECEAEKFEIRLTRLEQRWGHSGASRLPVARRPYVRRKRSHSLRFVEDVLPLEVEVLEVMGAEWVERPVAHHEARARRYWICPMCGGWTQRLYLAQRDAAEPEPPGIGCRRCARLAYKSQYQGRALITPERIQEAADRGPRQLRSPARHRYEFRLLLAEKRLQQRTRNWEQRWEAAFDMWLASHLVQATRMQVRLARLQLAELKAAQASPVECQTARDELRTWRAQKQVAQTQCERARRRYERLAIAA